MIALARNVLRGVLAATGMAVKSEVVENAPDYAAILTEAEAAEEDTPRYFVPECFSPECSVCQYERAQHPTLLDISCGTAGCPNASHPSAPGLGGLVERTTPEEVTDSPASSGASTSTTSGGGTASVGNQPLPGAVATPGAGQPLSQVLLSAAGFASAGGAPVWICRDVMDLAAQFRADELDAL